MAGRNKYKQNKLQEGARKKSVTMFLALNLPIYTLMGMLVLLTADLF